jgi:uncharacterized phage protein (TIGR01671 family)
MREILFRAKKNPSDEWIEGFLVGRCHIGDWVTCEPVHSKTVGQFTGLTDKNGTKIFEGDIVKAERICNGNIWTGCVAWWNGFFAIQGLKDGNNVPAIDLFKNYEVIGNIHDNPELLEE